MDARGTSIGSRRVDSEVNKAIVKETAQTSEKIMVKTLCPKSYNM